MPGNIGDRKTDHLTLCATGDVGFRGASTLLENVKLVHDALPDLDHAAIDTSLTVLGKRLDAPLCIAAMTGGTAEAGRINRELATLAEEHRIAFGLGSQRAMHQAGARAAGTGAGAAATAATAATYSVRDVAPTTLLLGNLGVVQAKQMSNDEIAALVGEVGADALCIHLNPAMELVQPGGDREFSGGLETIARLVEALAVPIVVKETGCGISPLVAARLVRVGVRHIDVSGAGGTSWVGVETKRADERGDVRASALGEALWDWGIPTAASVALLAPLGLETLIATGGIKSGVDVAKSIALGATAGGIARPMLRALHEGGCAGATSFLEAVLAELRAVMLLTGSKDLAALRVAPRVVVGELRLWLDRLSPASLRVVPSQAR